MSDKNQKVECQDERDIGAFITAALDDYGLNPFEFRIYARIVRRAGSGQAWESIANMAKACKLCDRKVKDAVALLAKAGMIRIEQRTGKTSLYRIRPQRDWVHPELLDSLREEVLQYKTKVPSTQVPDTQVCRTQVRGNWSNQIPTHPGTRYLPTQVPDTYKGIPVEGISSEGVPDQMSYADAQDPIAPPLEVEVLDPESEPPNTKPLSESSPKKSTPVKPPSSKKDKKVPRSRRKAKSEAEHHPEAFNQWWKAYYTFCYAVECEQGHRHEAVAAWDEILADDPDGEVLQQIFEGTEYYILNKQKQYINRGQAIAVSHGMRYLRDRKWFESLERKQVREGLDLVSCADLKQMQARQSVANAIANL